jgi:hypothetical protein
LKRLTIALLLLVVFAAPVAAKGNPHASCSISPAEAFFGDTLIVTATGLPVDTPITLVVNVHATDTVTQLGTTSDGTLVVQQEARPSGVWTFEFTKPIRSNGTYFVYASCFRVVQ